jgi:hypothetical protein
MRKVRQTLSIVFCVGVLGTAGSPARATELANVPSFHRVLMVNDASAQAVVPTESGLITATIEVQQADGRWRSVARVRAPVGTSHNVVLQAGEIWQFIVPGSARGLPVKARLALGVVGGTIHSQPFALRVEPLPTQQTMDCWLARIRPAHVGLGPVIAVAKTKRAN